MKKRQNGFTLIELAIVIVIIAILASITIFTYVKVQVNSRDSTRSTRTSLISEALERYYAKNGQYPGCLNMQQSGSQVSTLLGGIDAGVFVTPTAPSTTTNSISTCSDLTAGLGGVDTYAYAGGDLSTACTTGNACSTYTLEYRQESTGNIISIRGQHAATTLPVAAPSAPIVSAAMSGTNAVGTATTVSCSIGIPQYQLRSSSTNTGTAGSWSSWSSWSSAQQTLTVAALQGYQYSFQAEAQCYNSGSTSASSPVSNTATVVRAIGTPVAPTYTGPTAVNSNQTYNANYSSTCPSGTSIINGTYRATSWTGGTFGPHPFGYLDSWQNTSTTTDHTVEVWGKYECTTTYSTSVYSPESDNLITVHHQ